MLRHFHEAAGPATVCLKKVEIDPSLAEIRGRKEGPVNWRGMARDIRGFWHGEIMANRHHARQPSFRALIEAAGPLYLAPLPRLIGGY